MIDRIVAGQRQTALPGQPDRDEDEQQDGGYLREAKLIATPAPLLIRQGESMGRPGRLSVEILASGGIIVKGAAIPMTGYPAFG